MSTQVACIVLAAGKGTRMKSDLPKVLQPLSGKPMIAHVLTAAGKSTKNIVVVVAPEADAVRAACSSVRFAVQDRQLGTGHAVNAGMQELADFSGDVLVAFGDTPLLSAQTLSDLIAIRRKEGAQIALAAMQPHDPMGYGRLVMKEPPLVDRIVECKDASLEEKQIRWVWGGVMAFDAAFLREGLANITPSAKTGEYYLTDLVKFSKRTVMLPVQEEEMMGVNDKAQLAEAEYAMQQRLRAAAMENGVTFTAPETVFLSTDTQFGRDVVVQPNVVFGPGVKVGDRVEIRSFSHIEGAAIGSDVVIGPFARLRPGTQLADKVHIGNFVELKQSQVAEGAKINHLSYVGDASVGAGANVGAGTITCNYDGIMKHRTTIGAGAFIGSNSSLVAPVTIGDGAIVGAGSVVTEDVPADALTIERSTQQVKAGGASKWKEKNKK